MNWIYPSTDTAEARHIIEETIPKNMHRNVFEYHPVSIACGQILQKK